TRRARARRGCRGPTRERDSVHQIGLDLAGDLVESRLVANGEVREHLAIDVDVGALQARHERAVAHAELAHRGVDASDPQRPELAFLLPAVAIGVLPRFHQRLLRDPVDVLAPAAEALRLFEDFLVARARRYASLDSWHGALLTTSTAASRESPPCWSDPPGCAGACGAYAWCSSSSGCGAC